MLKRCVELIEMIREGDIMEVIKTPRRFLINKAKEKILLHYFKLLSRNSLILRKIQGSKMYLDISDPGISKELLFKGIHEDMATRVLKQEIKKGMTTVDIGANLGYYALLEASIVGDEGKVIAFEPVPRNFNILVKAFGFRCYFYQLQSLPLAGSL